MSGRHVLRRDHSVEAQETVGLIAERVRDEERVERPVVIIEETNPNDDAGA